VGDISNADPLKLGAFGRIVVHDVAVWTRALTDTKIAAATALLGG